MHIYSQHGSTAAGVWVSHRSTVTPRNTGTTVLRDAVWPSRNQRSSCCGHGFLKNSSDSSTTASCEECTAASIAAGASPPTRRLSSSRNERRPMRTSRRYRHLPNALSSPAWQMNTSQAQRSSWKARCGGPGGAAPLATCSVLSGCLTALVDSAAQGIGVLHL